MPTSKNDDREDAREVLAMVDAIMTATEKLDNDFANIDKNVNISINPFDFLIELISKKVSKEEMMDWLVNVITEYLPALELAVKGVLLSSLKENIDCTNDPRIPNELRKNPYASAEENLSNGYNISIESIDYNGILNISPFSKYGKNHYFGVSKWYTIESADMNDDFISNTKFTSINEAEFEIRTNKNIKNGDYNIITHESVKSVYELSRANDFNAFLWFVTHKSRFGTFYNFDDLPIKEGKLINEDGGDEVNPFGRYYYYNNLTDENSHKELIPGNIIRKSNSSIGSLCISQTELYDNYADNDITKAVKVSKSDKLICSVDPETEKIDVSIDTLIKLKDTYRPRSYQLEIVPFTSSINIGSNLYSINWYTSKDYHFNFLKPENDRQIRDYSKEYPICSLTYLGLVDNGTNPFHRLDGNLNFSIQPKPFVHVPTLKAFEAPWRFKKILFDSEGNPNSKGKYSCRVKGANGSDVVPVVNGDDIMYGLIDGFGNIIGYLHIQSNTGKYFLEMKNGISKCECLYECYPGLTVYEFNYDYVMGMQLYDPVTLSAKLINMVSYGLMSPHGSMNIAINKSETPYQMRIAEIVKNIINSADSELSDCFYSFSNTKFTEMLNEAELKRSQLYSFQDSSNHASKIDSEEIYNILNEFNYDGTLEENKEIISRAINTATVNIVDEVLPEDRYNVSKGLVTEMIKCIVNVIVEAILSPKIILLFKVNKRLMGDDSDLSFEEFFKSIIGLLTAIVYEIRDLILQLLLDWATNIMADLMVKLQTLVIKEQLFVYIELMKKLIKACTFKGPHRPLLDSNLDNVDYADIDQTDSPQISNC